MPKPETIRLIKNDMLHITAFGARAAGNDLVATACVTGFLRTVKTRQASPAQRVCRDFTGVEGFPRAAWAAMRCATKSAGIHSGQVVGKR